MVSTHGNLLALGLSAIDATVAYDVWDALSFPDVFRVDLVDPLTSSRFERVWRSDA